MKKNVVYPMIALSAIPMANVVAADVSTIPLIQSKWFGTGLNYDNEGAIIVNPSGDPIIQNVGVLVKGTYVFKYNFLETDGSAIVIEVGGAKKTVEADKLGAGELEFTLSSEQQVTVKISSAQNKSFMIGDMVVELRFDFDKAIDDLKKMSDNELYRIQIYNNTDRKKRPDQNNKVDFYDLTEGGAVDQMIQDIVDNPDYETYQKYQLWDYTESDIYKKIVESAKKAAADEDAFEGKEAEKMLQDLEDAKKDIDELSEYSQPALNKVYEQIKKDIEAYKKATEQHAKDGKYPAYDFNAVTNAPNEYLKKLEALQKRLDQLNQEIKKQQDLNDANDAAFTALLAQLNDAKNSYTANRNWLEEALADATYDYWFGDTEEAGKYERFKQLLADAITEMDEQAIILRKLFTENTQKHDEGTSVANQKSLSDRITDVDNKLDQILEKYQNRLEVFFKALQAKIDEQKKLNDKLDWYCDVVEKLDQNPANIKKVQDLINALLKKIDDANDASDPDTRTLEDLDITGDLAAIDAAFKKMADIADVDQQNYEAWQAQVALYNDLLANFNNGKTFAKSLTYDQFFGSRSPYEKYQTKYEGTSSTNAVPNPLQKQLNDIKNKIQAEYNNYFTSTINNPYRYSGPIKNDAAIKESIKKTQEDLDATNKNIEESTEWYNHLAEIVRAYEQGGVVDGVTIIGLNEVTEKVKDLDIYKQSVTRNGEVMPNPETPVKGNTYEEKIATIQKQINAIRNEVNNYWNNNQPNKNYKWFEVPYGDKIKGIKDDATPVSIIDQINSLNDNYQKDQDRFDQIQASIVLEELMESVQMEIQDATDRLNGVKIATETDPFTEDIQDKRQKLQDVLDAIKKVVEESGYDDALASDTDIEDDIAVIDILTKASEDLAILKNNPDSDKMDITKLEKYKDDAKANFKANKELNDLWNEVYSDLEKAKKDAAAEDPDAGTKHWQNPVIKELEDLLNDIKTEMAESYNAMTSVQDKGGYEDRLDDLHDNINGVKQRVINNLDCYEGDALKGIKGLLAYEEDVQNKWDEVAFYIASMDISQTRDEYQLALTSKKNILIGIIMRIKDRYDRGLYDDGRTDPQYLDDVNALLNVLADLNCIIYTHLGKYYTHIISDNKAVLDKTTKALQEAQVIFNTANETLKTYDDLETENLQKAVEQAMIAANNLNQTLKQYPTELDNYGKNMYAAFTKISEDNAEIAQKATDVWEPVKDLPDGDPVKEEARAKIALILADLILFDPDLTYVDEIKDKFTDPITDAYRQFNEIVYKAISDAIQPDLDYVKAQCDAATSSISGYGNDLYNATGNSSDRNFFNNWFNKRDVDGTDGLLTLRSKALDLAKLTSNANNIKDLDKIMTLLSQENVDRRILTLMNMAADKVESTWLSILQQEVKDGRAWIAQVHDDNPNKQGWIAEFEQEIKDNVDPAQALYDENYVKEENGDMTGDLPGVYDEIKAFYKKFHHNNRYWKLKNSYDQYVKETNALKNAQTELDKVIALVEQYEVSGQEKEKYLNAIQKTIDERLAAAVEALRAGEATKLRGNANDLLSTLNLVKGQYLYEDEYQQLLADIQDLEQELNRFANDVVLTDPEYQIIQQEVKGYKDEIEKIKSNLNTTYTNNKPPKKGSYTPSALLPYEETIAKLLAKINSANDAAQAQRVVALLNGKIADLEAKAKTLENGEYDKEIVDTYQTDIDRANAEIEKVKKIVSDNAAQIMFYRDKAEDEMAAIDKWLDNVIAKANADQQALNAKRAANELAFTTLNSELDELRAKIAASQAKVDEYQYTKSADYSNQYGLVTEQIDLEAANIAEQHEAVELTAASKVSEDLIKYVDDKIVDIENTAANREISSIVANLQNQADYLLFTESQYTLAVWKEMQDEIESIKEAIADLDVAVKDAKANLESDAKLDGQKAEAAVIQQRIDDLKAKAAQEVINKAAQGDVSGDGAVTVADYRVVLGYVLNGAPEKGTAEYAAADVNKDGEVNSGDMVAITNIILYGDPKGQQAQEARGIREKETVSADYAEGRVSLKLDNSYEYAAAQFDVILPEGASIKASLATRAEKFELNTAKNQDGSVRVVISSVLGRIMEGNSGAVVYFDVEGASSNELGFDNIIFTDNHANAKKFDAILGEATAIDSVSAEIAESTEAYNLGGRMMNAVKKGVNIVRDAAGKMKKVVVK